MSFQENKIICSPVKGYKLWRFIHLKWENNKHISCRAGGKAGAVRPCQGCKGRGMKVTIRPIGPGMVQQIQSSCNECGGEGTEILIHFSPMQTLLLSSIYDTYDVQNDENPWVDWSSLTSLFDEISMLPSYWLHLNHDRIKVSVINRGKFPWLISDTLIF